jgi:hypothetical protein
LAVKHPAPRKSRQMAMARPLNGSSRQPRRRLFRTRRRFGWGRIKRLPLPWMAAVACSIALLYFVVLSGTFTVRAVATPHVAKGEAAQILARCDCVDKSIFTLQTDEIKRRLNGIPALVIDRVSVSLPNNITVIARYKARVAIWRTPEAAYAVATDGEVLQVWKTPFPKQGWKGLPVFDEGYDSVIKKGHRLLVGEHVGVDAIHMALSLKGRTPAELKPLVKGYTFKPFTGGIVVGKTNWWALFGMDRSNNLDFRMKALLGALTSKPPLLAGGRCIDLREANVPGSPLPYIHPNHNCG